MNKLKCIKNSSECKLILLFFFIFLFFSCEKESAVKFEVSEMFISKDSLVNIQKNMSNEASSYLTQFVNSASQLIVSAPYNDSILYYYNTSSQETDYFHIPFKLNLEYDLFNYSEDSIIIFHQNNLLSYRILDSRIDTLFSGVLEKNEFAKKEMYGSGILKLSEGYVINYGIELPEENFIDTTAMYLIKNKRKQKLLYYPKEFENYIHYNDLILCNDVGNIYYTFSTGKTLSKFNIETKELKQRELINADKYLTYDTLKFKDMSYLVEYSHNTKYNLKLFEFSNYIALITYQPAQHNTPSNSKWIHSINIYDKNLNYIDKIDISHPVIKSLISANEEYIFFLYPPNEKMYRYKIEL